MKTKRIEFKGHTEVQASGTSMFHLMAIRDVKLWRGDYKSWAEYCEKRWGSNKRYCNRLIEGSVIVQELGPMGPTLVSERQARELSAIAPTCFAPTGFQNP